MNVVRMTAAEFRMLRPLYRHRDVILELACRVAFPMDFLRYLSARGYLFPHERKRIIRCFKRITKEYQG